MIASPLPDPATIDAAVPAMMREMGLRAAIYRIVVAGEPLVTAAVGESMTGVPATVDMRFRSGAVAIGYLSTLLLILTDEGVIGLDDPIAAWLPNLPDAGRVTPRMLISMSAGYPDYVPDAGFQQAAYADPFRAWTAGELIEIGLRSLPRSFAPGTNWDYSHANIVILGQVLEAATGQPLGELLRARVFEPLGLTGTASSQTATIDAPVLHAFSSERKGALGIADDVPFYEEATFWNPSWTLAPGAITTSDIVDLTTTAIAWGSGALLTPASHLAQITPFPPGFGAKVEGCRTCHPLDETHNYALGLIVSGDWILQNPSFFGYSAAVGCLPSERIAIAAAVTFAPGAFTETGDYRQQNAATDLLKRLAATVTSNVPLLT